MSSNLRVKPIERSSEKHKTEESFGEFVVAGADAAEAFESGVGVFDGVAMGVELRIEGVGFAAARLGRDAGEDAVGCKSGAQPIGIKRPVSHKLAAAQFVPQASAGFQVMTVTRRQLQRDQPASPSTIMASLVLRPPLVRPIACACWPPTGLAPFA